MSCCGRGDEAPGRRAPKRNAREPISPPRKRIAPVAYIIVSAILFFIGVVGVLLIQLMSIELLFNSANPTFARSWANNAGDMPSLSW